MQVRVASMKMPLGYVMPIAAFMVAAFGGETEAAEAPRVTFTKDVAPILHANCVRCHRPGQVAPMSLLTFEEARPWAKSIKKNVEEGEMPPWKADPKHGRFRNDIRLSEEEKATLIAWVDQGAPQGNPKDMPTQPEFSDGWELGEPDFVVEMPEAVLSATGDDLFLSHVVEINLPEQRWVRAIEFSPGDRKVVHHILALLGDFGMSSGEPGGQSRGGTQAEIFSVWVAGSQPTVYPEGAGRIIRKKQVMTFNMHYHLSGEATVDRSRVGLYFGEGNLEKLITTTFAVNTGFVIPPGHGNYRVDASYLFDQDSEIISFLPHMHVRGKDMKYTAMYPDGRSEVLLSVPEYDYNWQWIYYPAEHISVPAGTRIDVVVHYDNSADNLSNPDPTAEVYYRDDTYQEMFVGFMEFIVDDGVRPKPRPPRTKLATMLEAHPAQDSYLNGGLMGLPWGLYIPREGEGIWYLVLGSVMFTSTVHDIAWDGDTFSFESGMVTAGGGGISMSVSGGVNSEGEMNGEVLLGTMEAAADPENNKVITLPFTGHRINPAATLAAR